jgi:hypothetical protein
MVGLSTVLDLTDEEKVELAYNLYDNENSGYLMFMEVQRIFYVS